MIKRNLIIITILSILSFTIEGAFRVTEYPLLTVYESCPKECPNEYLSAGYDEPEPHRDNPKEDTETLGPNQSNQYEAIVQWWQRYYLMKGNQ